MPASAELAFVSEEAFDSYDLYRENGGLLPIKYYDQVKAICKSPTGEIYSCSPRQAGQSRGIANFVGLKLSKVEQSAYAYIQEASHLSDQRSFAEMLLMRGRSKDHERFTKVFSNIFKKNLTLVPSNG